MPHIATYVGMLHRGERTLGDSFRVVGEGHGKDAEIRYGCRLLAGLNDDTLRELGPVVDRFGEEGTGDDVEEPDRLHADGVGLGLYSALVAVVSLAIAGAVGLAVHQPWLVAACLSLGLTALVLQALHCAHPPAGATTLIVSLGLLTTTTDLLVMFGAVLLCMVVAVVLQRVAEVRQASVPAVGDPHGG